MDLAISELRGHSQGLCRNEQLRFYELSLDGVIQRELELPTGGVEVLYLVAVIVSQNPGIFEP
jgi:hypothetical protein